MPYCPNCSTVLKLGAAGCPECGAERSAPGGWHTVRKPLGGTAPPPQSLPAVELPAPDPKETARTERNFRLLLRAFVGLLALALPGLMFEEGASSTQRLLAAAALCAALFFVVFLHRWYLLSMGLFFGLPGALLTWIALFSAARVPPAAALLVLGAAAVLTALIPAMRLPRRALRIAAIVAVIAVGSSLVLYLLLLERVELLFGLPLCAVGFACCYGAWEELRAKRKAPSSSAP